MKVLIVDDEINVREVIRYFGNWEKYGITSISEASNGEEAIELIEEQSPEIIITDVKMPRMSGMEIIEWLDKFSYKGKVIFISGFDDYSYMRKAIQYSSFDYLLKPIEPASFNRTLEEAVNARRLEKEARDDKGPEVDEEIKRLQLSQIVTSACLGESFNLKEITAVLPSAYSYDISLFSFYQDHYSGPYIQLLADELVKRRIGNAFSLQTDRNLGLVITVEDQWLSVEEWMSNQFDIPSRYVKSPPIQSLKNISDTYQGLQEAMENQKFSTVQRLNNLDAARRMDDIVSYVETYYMEDLSLEKLSQLFFFSREHISRKFKKVTGMTLSKYMIKLRTDQAKKWLKETNESILSISLMLGYKDEKYFSKLFKKVVGQTPFEYRSKEKFKIVNS